VMRGQAKKRRKRIMALAQDFMEKEYPLREANSMVSPMLSFPLPPFARERASPRSPPVSQVDGMEVGMKPDLRIPLRFQGGNQ
jgi:hypothetical protein